MAPKIGVFHDADTIVPKINDGAGTFSDLAGSDLASKSPVCVGVWDLHLDKPTSTIVAQHDEVKYIIKGELVVKDEATGETHTMGPGSLLWIPAGSKVSILSSNELRTVYFESRQMVPDGYEGPEGRERL
ncbi:hypothetical protein ACHAPJ_011825 [Fusarium lateritium]